MRFTMCVGRRVMPSLAFVSLFAICCCHLPRQRVAAQELSLDDSALTIVPADAAFFSTSLNMRESFEEFLDGRFMQRVRAVPFTQRLEAELARQWENPPDELRQAKAVIESPNVVNLLKLFKDMLSSEMFVYGGDDWCDAIEGLMDLQNEITTVAGQGDEEAIQAYLLNLTQEDVARLRIPTTVLGFRLADDGNARQQLDALEGILRFGLGNVDELKQIIAKLRRTDFSDGQTLSISLDSSLIPPLDLEGDQGAMAQKMLSLLEGRSLTLAIGVKNNILLMAIGEGAGLIESVGKVDTPLLSHDAFDVLKEQLPPRLRSVGFMSERWRQSQWDANFNNYFGRMTNQLVAALESEAGADPEIKRWQADLQQDAQWLDDKLEDVAPEFGPMVSWSHAIGDGLEGFAYDWTENISFENVYPLSILKHTGRELILSAAWKQRENPALRDLFEYVLDKAPNHIRRFISLAEEDEADRQQALMVLDRGWPLVQDIYTILRDRVGPSLEDNESVLSLAANWTTSELGPAVPPPARPLPLPELAMACKLKNRDLFLSGCAEIYEVLDQVVALVRDVEPGAVPPNYTVPRPNEEALTNGTRYFYAAWSSQVPLEGFEPQVVVGDDVVLFGYSMRQVDDMLEEIAEPNYPAWLEDEQPVCVVSYVNFANMINSIRPWAEFGFSMSGLGMNTPLTDAPGPVPTANEVLELWDTLTELGEVHASVATDDAGITVTHWRWTSL